jgi:hypothetical protein
MRRAAIVLATTLTLLTISAPAAAYAHDRVANPFLHAVLDVLTLAVVTAPVWTVFSWSRGRRSLWLAGLIAVVQLPAAVMAFTPIANPLLHTVALVTGLALTASSIVYVRREARAAELLARSVAR